MPDTALLSSHFKCVTVALFQVVRTIDGARLERLPLIDQSWGK
jgi:hypothetical protein